MLSRRLPSYLLAALLTLAVGMGVTAALFASVRHLETDKQRLDFQQRANARVAAIRKGFDEAVDVLSVTNHLFSTVDTVTREQFHAFTTPLLRRYRFIQAFNFHRDLNQDQRAAFEAELARLLPGTVLHEMQGNTITAAPVRAHYRVVDYLEPLAGNEAALGLNVDAHPGERAALERAVERNGVAATGRLTLAQDHAPLRAFAVLMPVYRPGADLSSAAARRAALIGDTAAIIGVADLVQVILSEAGLEQDNALGLRLYASETADAATLAFDSSARTSLAPQALAPAGRHTQAHIDVAGQPWLIDIDAAAGPLLHEHLGSVTTLTGGILLSVLLALLVHGALRRTQGVQALVEQRTADLERSNRRLIDDVAARQRTEHALQESEQRFRQLVAMSSDWYWEQDEQLRFTMITGGVGEKAGVAVERFIGKTRWETVTGMADTDWGQAHIAQVAAHQSFSGLEYTIVDERGQPRWFSVNGQPKFDRDGVFCGYRGTGTDITERKLDAQRIAHIAHHDVLTGLPNRALLHDRLAQAIAYSARSGRSVWVMLIDLDRFKFVNDSMGHKAGDLLLQTVATRLESALRDSDTVARLSGDEFVAILAEHPSERLSIDIVQRVMDTVARPVMLDGKQFHVTCSIGVAIHPTDDAPSTNLLEHADIAMYRAKKLGRNNFQFYTPAMNEEALERLRIESALRNALELNQFVLHYQPQVDLASGRVVGMEALLRWQHPELGVVAPVRFIGLAEETGLIVPIGAWAMRQACLQTRAWQDAGLGALRIAVNLSARQFAEPGLLELIANVLAETALDPAKLEIELTESLFMNDVDQAVELMNSMKGLGVSISIDDFGTGYSSLSYLSRFPIDVLKIDRSFVHDITGGANGAPIVASIIALAHNLKLKVIAEGVETEPQLDYLRAHGCDEMQGYLFSRPLDARSFEQLLRDDTSLPVPTLAGESAFG